MHFNIIPISTTGSTKQYSLISMIIFLFLHLFHVSCLALTLLI